MRACACRRACVLVCVVRLLCGGSLSRLYAGSGRVFVYMYCGVCGYTLHLLCLQDANEEAPEFDVPNTDYKLRVMDNKSDRKVGGNEHVYTTVRP